MKRNHSRAGFSLVELAIVLVIIGLIVGGVLQGQDLIRSARLNSVQTDLNKIRTAVGTFQDRFVALPGDLSRAELLNDSWTNGDDDGDGNGRIGSPGSGTDWSTGENGLFWMHLAEAGMLSGVNAQTIREDNSRELNFQASGGSFESSLGGSFTINFANPGNALNRVDDVSEDDFPAGTGHWIMLAGGVATSGNFSPDNNNTEGIIAPVELRSIDLKADDGSPINGDVLGVDADTGDAATCVPTGGDEYGTSNSNVCLAAFGL